MNAYIVTVVYLMGSTEEFRVNDYHIDTEFLSVQWGTPKVPQGYKIVFIALAHVSRITITMEVP